MLEMGTVAPAFTLPDKEGKLVSLKDFAGKKVVLYFYPKDSTPGCTRQAQAFRDAFAKFEEAVSEGDVLADDDTVISGKADTEVNTAAKTEVNAEAEERETGTAMKTETSDDANDAEDEGQEEDEKKAPSDDAEQKDEMIASSAKTKQKDANPEN